MLKVIDDAGEPGSHIASINLWLDHVDEEAFKITIFTRINNIEISRIARYPAR